MVSDVWDEQVNKRFLLSTARVHMMPLCHLWMAKRHPFWEDELPKAPSPLDCLCFGAQERHACRPLSSLTVTLSFKHSTGLSILESPVPYPSQVSHWSLCCCLIAQSRPTLLQPHGLGPTKLLCPWDFPGKNMEVGCHFLLQGYLSNPGMGPEPPALEGWFFTTEPPEKPTPLHTDPQKKLQKGEFILEFQ